MWDKELKLWAKAALQVREELVRERYPRPGIYWAVYGLQYCCRIQENLILNSDRCISSVLCSEKQQAYGRMKC